MEIAKSVFSLTKNNNGFFKSKKQSDFLISQMDSMEGWIGSVSSGYNSCSVFATYDAEGIIKLEKSTKIGSVIMFERKKEGTLTSLEIKLIKKYERNAKGLRMRIAERRECFDSGDYNRSGDVSTYTEDAIASFNRAQDGFVNQLKGLEELISNIKNN